MRRQLEGQLKALDYIQKIIKGNMLPFNREIGEFAETFNFCLINGNYSGVKDDYPPVPVKHRFNIKVEAFFAKGKHLFPVVYPAH
jgi:hypothetical protein